MICSEKNLRAYVARNPGMTATMIGKCIRKRYGTISAALYLLVKAGKLQRQKAVGERGGSAWRYYFRIQHLPAPISINP